MGECLLIKFSDAPAEHHFLTFSPQQHWSLMPLHGVFSVVRPAYYCHGPSTSGDFGGFSFPSWFGKNSTQGKLSRVMGEIHGRMRMKISGDKRETLMNYLPVLYPRLMDPLVQDGGAEMVDQIIALMDEYYLTKEEWDNLVEIMAIGKSAEEILKQIPSATKSAFTRKSVDSIQTAPPPPSCS
jgi:replication factor C subunit 1